MANDSNQVMSPPKSYDKVRVTVPTFDGKAENFEVWSKRFKAAISQLGLSKALLDDNDGSLQEEEIEAQ